MNMLDITDNRRLKLTGRIINRYASSGKLLDIGCKDRSLSKYLHFIKYEGIDYPEVDLEKDKLPYKSKSFDFVACLEVIEHLKDPTNIISEINKVSKKDAIIFISLPNSNHIYYRLKFLFGKPGDMLPFSQINKHLHFPIKEQSIKFIKNHFKILEIIDIGLPPYLDSIFPRLFSYSTLFILKKKNP